MGWVAVKTVPLPVRKQVNCWGGLDALQCAQLLFASASLSSPAPKSIKTWALSLSMEDSRTIVIVFIRPLHHVQGKSESVGEHCSRTRITVPVFESIEYASKPPHPRSPLLL